MRLFVAADVPQEMRGRLITLQQSLRELPFDLRLVRPEGIHLTLRFIGEVGEDRFDDIVAALDGPASAGLTAFDLRAAGLGFFPPRGTPKVIWVDLQGDREAAGQLAAAIETALEGCGLPPEKRPFMPHLTVARVRSAQRGDWQTALARVAEQRLGDLKVDHYYLYESQLGSGGATYRRLFTWELSGRSAR